MQAIKHKNLLRNVGERVRNAKETPGMMRENRITLIGKNQM